MDNIFERAKAIQDEVIAIRRDIHAHPEIGHQEYRTSKLILDALTKAGVDTIEQLTPTSVTATITGTATASSQTVRGAATRRLRRGR